MCAVYGNFDEDVFNSYIELIAAIIKQALIDKRYGTINQRRSANIFFKSFFFSDICDILNVDKQNFLLKMKKNTLKGIHCDRKN